MSGLIDGEMSEWLKEHAWKVCIRLYRIEGSNPSLSARNNGDLCWSPRIAISQIPSGPEGSSGSDGCKCRGVAGIGCRPSPRMH